MMMMIMDWLERAQGGERNPITSVYAGSEKCKDENTYLNHA